MGEASEIDVIGSSPFRITPDSRFFHRGRSVEASYESLLEGVQERQGIMLLVGEAGTGKTTLLLNLQEELERVGCLVVYPRRPMLSFDELTQACCEAAGIAKEEIERLDQVRAFSDLLVAQVEEGGTTAVFIDDAHTVSDDFLIDLSRLTKIEKGGRKLLQVILAGQLELVNRLTAANLPFVQECAIAYRSLEPLGKGEVEEYIAYRLARVGHTGPDFSAKALKRIAQISSGIPQVINQLCGMSLQMAELEDATSVGLDQVDSVAADLLSAHDGEAAGAPPHAEEPLDRADLEVPDDFDDVPPSREEIVTPTLLVDDPDEPDGLEPPEEPAAPEEREAWLEKAFAEEVLGREGRDELDEARLAASARPEAEFDGDRPEDSGEADSDGSAFGFVAVDWNTLEAGVADRGREASEPELPEAEPLDLGPDKVVPLHADRPSVAAPAAERVHRPARSAPNRRVSVAAMFLFGLLFGGLGVGALWIAGGQEVGSLAQSDADSGDPGAIDAGTDNVVAAVSGSGETSPADGGTVADTPAEGRDETLALAPAGSLGAAPEPSDGAEAQQVATLAPASDPETNGVPANGAQPYDDEANGGLPSVQPAAGVSESDQPGEAAAPLSEAATEPAARPAKASVQEDEPEALRIPKPPVPKPAILTQRSREAGAERPTLLAAAAAPRRDAAPAAPEAETASVAPAPSSAAPQDEGPALQESAAVAEALAEPVAPAKVAAAGRGESGAVPQASDGTLGAPTSLLPSLAVIEKLQSALPAAESPSETDTEEPPAAAAQEPDTEPGARPGPAIPLVQTAEASQAVPARPGAADLGKPTSLLPAQVTQTRQLAARTESPEPASVPASDSESAASPESEAAEGQTAALQAEPAPAPLAETANAPAPESPVAVPISLAPVGQEYMLQFASLSSRSDAERERTRLIERHWDLLGDYDLTIARGDVQGRAFYRVRSSPLGDSEMAYDTCAQLVVRGQGCMVLHGESVLHSNEPVPGATPDQNLETSVKVAGALGATAEAEGVSGSSAAALAPPDGMAVLEFLLTRDVEGREPVDKTDRFAASDREGFAYARIKNLGSPTRVAFLWHKDKELVSRYRTTIGTSGRWRTWSSTELWPGEWSVAIVKESGEVLAEANFVVE